MLTNNATNQDLQLRIGVHRASAMVATVNGKLDYFGTTVKHPLRVPSFANESEMSITQSLASDPQVQTLLLGRGLICAVVDGVKELPTDIPLYRLTPKQPNNLVRPETDSPAEVALLTQTPIV